MLLSWTMSLKKLIVKPVNTENVKLKERTDSNLKEVLNRIKAEKEKQENVVMELEANILMLENVVESRNERIYTLEEEFKQMEETYSTSIIPNCESCEDVADTQSFVNKHDTSNHSDENLPSTSKCGVCDYSSDNEKDVNQHMKRVHEFCCNICSFEANTEWEIENHEIVQHNYNCLECNETFRTADKLEIHICKHEVINPSYSSYYMRGWVDINGCSPVYCGDLEQKVAIIHKEQCASQKKPCSWAPFTLNRSKDEVIHLEFEKLVKLVKPQNVEILWEQLSADIK